MTQENRQKNPEELRRMGLVERSRHLAYQKPDSRVEEAQNLAKFRIQNKFQLIRDKTQSEENSAEVRERHQLTGELKSAEARARVNSLKIKYEDCRNREMNRIFLAQPTSLRALRLSSLLEEPLNDAKRIKALSRYGGNDGLNEIDRNRCETIIDDREGLTYERKMT